MGDLAIVGNPMRGRMLVARFECASCHMPHTQNSERDCVSCHNQVTHPAAPDHDRLSHEIQHYREIPTLHGIGKLLRKDWIVKFLLAPHDLRPRLAETMPRLDLDERDAWDITAYLASSEVKEPYFADVAIADWHKPLGPKMPVGTPARGRAVYQAKGCGACHVYTGVTDALPIEADRLEARQLQLAVDLRFTRERFEPAELVPWLLSPRHHKFDAAMPELGLTYQDARDLAAFMMEEPLAKRPRVERAKRLPVLDEPVTYHDVNERLFAKICVHCHEDESGPGSTGGFGFGPKGLSFSSYESIFAGYVDDIGRRTSVFAPTEDGTPLLVKVLLVRRDEEAGFVQDQHRGMPMSLPSVTPEVLQLVESWIAQGRPR